MRWGPCWSYCFFWMFVSVVMHKDKEDGMHHDSQFRNRDLTTYDHTLLDGEMFLQVRANIVLILHLQSVPSPCTEPKHFSSALAEFLRLSKLRFVTTFRYSRPSFNHGSLHRGYDYVCQYGYVLFNINCCEIATETFWLHLGVSRHIGCGTLF